MAGKWSNGTVSDFFDLVTGYAFKSADFVDDGIPVIKIKNIKAGEFSEHEFSYVSESFLHKRYEKLARPDDLLISMSGNRHDGSPETWVGKIARFWKPGDYFLNQRVGALRLKPGASLDARFTSFLLSSLPYQELFIAIATSSGGQANLSPKQIMDAPMRYPDLSSQRAIGHILGTLDDKIELNRRMNETLEAMGRALYMSWFVDFDPVRAKAEGRTGMPNALAELVPNVFENSELGEKPIGWRTGTVDEEFNLTMGQSPPGETYNENGEGLPFFQGRTDFGFRFPSERVFCTRPTRYANAGDTLISVRAPVGDVNMASTRCSIGRGVAAARHKSGSRSYTYYFMYAMEEVFSRFEAEGTVFGSISKKDFHGIQHAVPPIEVVRAFEGLVAPIDDKVANNESEARTLAALRDILLPKLISGELRVHDAERMLAHAPV